MKEFGIIWSSEIYMCCSHSIYNWHKRPHEMLLSFYSTAFQCTLLPNQPNLGITYADTIGMYSYYIRGWLFGFGSHKNYRYFMILPIPTMVMMACYLFSFYSWNFSQTELVGLYVISSLDRTVDCLRASDPGGGRCKCSGLLHHQIYWGELRHAHCFHLYLQSKGQVQLHCLKSTNPWGLSRATEPKKKNHARTEVRRNKSHTTIFPQFLCYFEENYFCS